MGNLTTIDNDLRQKSFIQRNKKIRCALGKAKREKSEIWRGDNLYVCTRVRTHEPENTDDTVYRPAKDCITNNGKTHSIKLLKYS